MIKHYAVCKEDRNLKTWWSGSMWIGYVRKKYKLFSAKMSLEAI
jgi:hypothetical protein